MVFPPSVLSSSVSSVVAIVVGRDHEYMIRALPGTFHFSLSYTVHLISISQSIPLPSHGTASKPLLRLMALHGPSSHFRFLSAFLSYHLLSLFYYSTFVSFSCLSPSYNELTCSDILSSSDHLVSALIANRNHLSKIAIVTHAPYPFPCVHRLGLIHPLTRSVLIARICPLRQLLALSFLH